MFWDSSAIVPLVFPEPHSAELERIAADREEPVIWWATPVECQAAIYRRSREEVLPAEVVAQALRKLDRIFVDADVVAATTNVRERARRLVAAHPLRAADGLQLAAALVACQEQPVSERFVCLDSRLREATRREGFTLLPASV